jgi:hypothetical protein
VRPALHQQACEADRRARGLQSGDRPGAPVEAVHDRRVELDQALCVEGRSTAGIEAGIVLEHPDRGFDGVDRIAVSTEDRSARIECVAQALPCALLMIGVAMGRAHRTCTAVYHEFPLRTGHGLLRLAEPAWARRE